jgi:hypothetical protein
MTLLPNIVEAIDRGVKIRIIESKEQVLEPNFSELTSEETRKLDRTRTTPLYEQRMLDDIHLQFFLSESNCVLSFPLSNNQYDYTGLYCLEESSLDWCNELFNYYWNKAIARKLKQPVEIKRGYSRTVRDQVTVQGVNDPQIDAQAIQDAVEKYREVILYGNFNLGATSIRLSKSVVVRGKGRKNGVPLTSIYKRGWSFPFRDFTGLFYVDEDDLDITIENLNITDFNFASISIRRNNTNSVKVLNNRVTVESGYGRGVSFGAFGDTLIGIHSQNVKNVLIEGNYIDLAYGFGAHRGSVSRGGIEEDPEYRPDLFNHEYFIGYGIACNKCHRKVELKNNIIRNASARGIGVGNHQENAEVVISGNIIESDVYGSYPYSSRESGAGIVAQTGRDQYNPNYSLRIEGNKIKLDKINQSGILALGPINELSEKFKGGVIRDNVIYLKNGYEGIHVRKCDEFEIIGNKILGDAYYGIRISGHRKFGDRDMVSYHNILRENDLKELTIKAPDDYVRNNLDGKIFSQIEPKTAYIWLDRFTKNNKIFINDMSLIDEGDENEIINPT